MENFSKIPDSSLNQMELTELRDLVRKFQNRENFILMTDSYKLTHHLLLPKGITKMYSYLESRGGEMEYTVFLGLQYYLIRYLEGVRITRENIEEAHKFNIAHFGFDCFDLKLWERILNVHDGKLPLQIKAIPEGTVTKTKNVLLTIESTDPECICLVQPVETLLMKLWYPITVATYDRHIKEIITEYWNKTSDSPEWLIDFMLHDFGYRGVSSEETAAIGGGAHLVNHKGTDTIAGIRMLQNFYSDSGEEMFGYSVIASEHSVTCAYGDASCEFQAYSEIIDRVKREIPDIGILSLVSDTYNIYRVCNDILPSLKHKIEGWKNSKGEQVKIVIRPDSGDPESVLFGQRGLTAKDTKLIEAVASYYNNDKAFAISLIKKGVFNILEEHFGSTINSKTYKKLNPCIGVLQGDGISLNSIKKLLERMKEEKFDTSGLVFGSGGKLLQAHDRDEQKFAIKATYIEINEKPRNIMKNPATDPGKVSKCGLLKLVIENGEYKTIQSSELDFKNLHDELRTVFENGEVLIKEDFSVIRERAKIQSKQLEIV